MRPGRLGEDHWLDKLVTRIDSELQFRFERRFEAFFPSVHSTAPTFAISCRVTEQDDGASNLHRGSQSQLVCPYADRKNIASSRRRDTSC